ncbi:hypothetical protein [Desulfobulbus elongatus]|uniref:hypothetical protein n=1 Tax=Desulfobulbus elongatus TaxID=53332 RepID=UPI000A62E860|nr:hypothetical protein [Desulfobulbus elongatus]
MKQTTENPSAEMDPVAWEHLLTVRKFVEKYPAFTENSIRWLIFNRRTNGFGECFLKVGPKRIFINVPKFFQKIQENTMEM